MVGGRAVESDEGGCELHLGVVRVELEGLFDEGVSFKTLGGIGRIFVDPVNLSESGGEIADVECSEVGGGRMIRAIFAGHEFEEELFEGVGIHLAIESGAAKGFHVDEDRGIVVEDDEGVAGKIFDVVGFGAGEIPVVADPGKGFGVADVEGVTNEWRTGEGGEDEKDEENSGGREWANVEFHDVAPWLEWACKRKTAERGQVLTRKSEKRN